MQSVDILRDDCSVSALLKLGYGAVARVRYRFVYDLTAPLVPLPNRQWIARERGGRREILSSEIRP
jgi:hypothetical protein